MQMIMTTRAVKNGWCEWKWLKMLEMHMHTQNGDYTLLINSGERKTEKTRERKTSWVRATKNIGFAWILNNVCESGLIKTLIHIGILSRIKTLQAYNALTNKEKNAHMDIKYQLSQTKCTPFATGLLFGTLILF